MFASRQKVSVALSYCKGSAGLNECNLLIYIVCNHKSLNLFSIIFHHSISIVIVCEMGHLHSPCLIMPRYNLSFLLYSQKLDNNGQPVTGLLRNQKIVILPQGKFLVTPLHHILLKKRTFFFAVNPQISL